MVRLLPLATLEVTRLGNSAMPRSDTRQRMTSAEERNAWPPWPWKMARGMLPMASTESTTIAHAHGKWRKFSSACGTVASAKMVVRM